MEVKTMRNSN